MEDENTTNDSSNGTSDVSPVPAKKQTRKERSKANAATQKPQQNKKHSLWRNFKSLSRTKQVELLLLGMVAIGGIGYLIAYICVSVFESHQTAERFNAEHRPKVIFSRPPNFVVNPAGTELYGTLTCDVVPADNRISLQTGTIYLWLRNIGNGDAAGAWVDPNGRIDPIWYKHPPHVDDNTCKRNPKPPQDEKLFAIYHGTEVPFVIRQISSQNPFTKKEPIALNEDFYFYLFPCVSYSSSDPAGFYRSCATYRFIPKGSEGNANPYAFKCEGRAITGSFQPTFAGYCEN